MFASAQGDSVKVLKNEVAREISPMSVNCFHSHDCCSFRCSCCRELQREQVYDTIDVAVFNDGSTRSTIHERYRIAKSNEIRPMKYLFKNNGNGIPRKYYVLSNWYFSSDESGLKEGLNEANDRSKQLVFDEENVYHLIDKQGNILKIENYATYPLNEYLDRASVVVGGRRIQGLMNRDGELLLRGFGYSWIADFDGKGYTFLQGTNGKDYIVSEKGELLLEEGLHDAEDLGCGYIKVKSSRGCRLMNINGRILNQSSFDDIGRCSDGMFWVRKKERYGFLNGQGDLVAKTKYKRFWPFSNGRAAVEVNGRWGFIDKTGKLVIPCRYDNVSMFGNGLAGVAIGANSNYDSWQLIDSMGNRIMNREFSEIHPFNDGYAVVYKHKSGRGVIDTKGNIVVECKFGIDNHNIYFPWKNQTILLTDYENPKKPKIILRNLKTGNNIQLKGIRHGARAKITNKNVWTTDYVVRNDKNKRGLVDPEGNTLIEAEYDQLHVLDRSKALVWKGEDMYIYNYEEATRKLFIKGKLSLLPSTGFFVVEDKEGLPRYFDYDGKEMKSY